MKLETTKTKYRIIVIIDRYLPILGGAQNNIHEICTELVQKGCQVVIFTRKITPDLIRREEKNGVFIYRFGYLPIRILSKLWFIFQTFLFLIFKQRHYDFILSVPCVQHTELIPPFLNSLFTKKPYIIRPTRLDNFDNTLIRNPITSPVQNIFSQAHFWREIYCSAKKIVALNQSIFDRAQELNIPNCTIINSGVDLHCFSPVSSEVKRSLQSKLNLPRGRVLLITVGRYVEGKNQISLIQAVEALYKEKSALKPYLIILGATEEKQVSSTEDFLKSYVRSNHLENLICFLDDVKNVNDYLRASDIFVFPSLYQEGMSRVLLEAMACGLPVICSSLPQNRCSFPEGYQFFFSPKDIVILKEKIIMLSNSPDLRKKIGNALSAYAVDYFSSNRVAEDYLALFDEIRMK